MELIERYLQAVKFWLPKKLKDDVGSELAADLYAQVEERQGELGRELTADEVDALLRQCGAPLRVATRYLPQRSLIGPMLFPIYLFVLKIVALCYLIPWLAVAVVLLVAAPELTFARHASGWLGVADSFFHSFFSVVFTTAAVVTLVFAVLERVQERTQLFDRWNPRQLPAVRDPNQIPRTGTAIELAVYVLIAMWFVANAGSPVIVDRPSFRLVLTADWSYFYWAYVLLWLGGVALSATNLVHHSWTRGRAAFRLALDLAGSLVFCWLLKVDIVASVWMPKLAEANAVRMVDSFNWWTAKMFPLALVVCTVITVVNAVRVVRTQPTGE